MNNISTPIHDFVRAYVNSDPLRLHMPGHKGAPLLGIEPLDITEFAGADVLYQASGIIAESRENARKIFDTYATFYATEGSSLCIRAMLFLTYQHARKEGKRPCIWAARNVHKSFLYALAMLDMDVEWLYPSCFADAPLSCILTPSEIDKALSSAAFPPTALYLTSPDYLGNIADIRGIAEICHKHKILLLVDNAHGAYLHFLPESIHPITLGADLCCDSAHKTLPALTGAAYLHIGQTAPKMLSDMAEHALSLFASTSPSYLTLQSLDLLNPYLGGPYRALLASFLKEADAARDTIRSHGYSLSGTEPLKITIHTKPYGYTGERLAALLQEKNILCEFADADYLVIMLSPSLGNNALTRLCNALCDIPQLPPLAEPSPPMIRGERVLTVREALLAPATEMPISCAQDRVLADASFSCPPAIPILVCGERITSDAIRALQYYQIHRCKVVDA